MNDMKSKLQFVFVHGLSGWGSYDERYRKIPYWGMRNGDLMEQLRAHGYHCHAASVAPTGSAWDRACELYAQLSGTRTDYGKAHSTENNHERYGKDFTGCPLIPEWNEKTRIVLLGHSFGGATIRMFADLMINGDEKEQNADPAECSALFKGGMKSRIHSLVTLASPMNGTTSYEMFMDSSFDPDSVKAPLYSRVMAKIFSLGTRTKTDQRNPEDFANYDMFIDNAMALNRKWKECEEIYYFSVPCSCTEADEKGNLIPVKKLVEPLYLLRAYQMCEYTGVTAGGYTIGEEWCDHDGLVNVISASWPLGSGHTMLNRNKVMKGVWNVYPVQKGDHMLLQGGLMRKHDVKEFYLDLLSMISSLQ